MEWEKIEFIFKKFEKDFFRALLFGVPGTGKTTFPTTIFNNCLSITLHEELSPSELLGFFVPKGNEFIFKPGPASIALKTGAPLILNEIDKASNSVFTILLNLLDDISILKVYLPNDEIIKPATGYKVIATMNGNLEDLPPALLDRFDFKFLIETPHPMAIEKIRNEKIKKLLIDSYSKKLNAGLTMREAIAIDKLLSKYIEDELSFKSVLPEEKAQELFNAYQLL